MKCECVCGCFRQFKADHDTEPFCFWCKNGGHIDTVYEDEVRR